MNSATTSSRTAAAREDRLDAEKTRELLAETAHRLSAHTSVLHATALRLLALESRMADAQRGSATRVPAAVALAPWRGALPRQTNSAILSAAPPVRLMAIHTADGNVSLLELCLLAALAKRAGARAVFEFGTFDGRTALGLAANLAPHGKVFTLDLPRPASAAARLPGDALDRVPAGKDARSLRYEGTPFEKSIVQLYGDLETFDFSPFLGAADFVFIDGLDTHEQITNASRLALRLLRKGRGIVAWHDYAPGCQPVVRALDELYANEPKLAGMLHIEGTDLAYARVGCIEGGDSCE
jgi:predicted O-methyltransferase YrrM